MKRYSNRSNFSTLSEINVTPVARSRFCAADYFYDHYAVARK